MTSSCTDVSSVHVHRMNCNNNKAIFSLEVESEWVVIILIPEAPAGHTDRLTVPASNHDVHNKPIPIQLQVFASFDHAGGERSRIAGRLGGVVRVVLDHGCDGAANRLGDVGRTKAPLRLNLVRVLDASAETDGSRGAARRIILLFCSREADKRTHHADDSLQLLSRFHHFRFEAWVVLRFTLLLFARCQLGVGGFGGSHARCAFVWANRYFGKSFLVAMTCWRNRVGPSAVFCHYFSFTWRWYHGGHLNARSSKTTKKDDNPPI